MALTPKQFADQLHRAARGTPAQLRGLLKSASLMMASAIKDNLNKGTDPDGRPFRALAHPRPAGGNKPLRDRGLLLASITSTVKGMVAVAGTNRVGAALHQHGGTVRPVKRKWLTIPLTKKAARSGGATRFPGELSPRINKKGTAGVLVDEQDVAQFALVKSVRVPARRFVGFGRSLLARLDKLFAEHVAKTLPGGPGPRSGA